MIQKYLLKLPWYRKRISQRLENQSRFYEQNRETVLVTYRHLLKQIPKIYPRDLQQCQKVNQLRWIYKQSKFLPNIHETEGRTRFAKQLLAQIARGDYRNLGDMTPNRHYEMHYSIKDYLNQSTPTKRNWWRGHIF